MKHPAKRIIGVVCALAMLAAMMPSAVWADPLPESGTAVTESAVTTEDPAAGIPAESEAEVGSAPESETEVVSDPEESVSGQEADSEPEDSISGEESEKETVSGEEDEPQTPAEEGTGDEPAEEGSPAGESAQDALIPTVPETDPAEEEGPTAGPTQPTTPAPENSAKMPAMLNETSPESDNSNFDLQDGYNVVSTSLSNTTFDIDNGQVLILSGQLATEDAPIVFTNCTFNLGGSTSKLSGTIKLDEDHNLSYNNGEVITKLWIGGNVQFDNCTFVTQEGAQKSSSAGYDACIYFFSGNITLNSCTLAATNYVGQFLGLYGRTGSVTFNNSNISTTNNKNGWSYAMYAHSVLKLNGSTMTATGTTVDSSNTNIFYSGDSDGNYDAVFFKDSTISFTDNKAGGFAINRINIYVDNSDITVSNNAGNACNSGYWTVTNGSSITMNGNRGGHALSCVGFEMTDSRLEIMHNGYAGIYLQSKDSSLTNCSVDVRCNGEKLWSYTAGDTWLVDHKLTVSGGTSNAAEGSPWLGGVGRKGNLVTTGDTTVVAYDLYSNAVDNLKSNTSQTIAPESVALNQEEDQHTLLLNPLMKSDYARGNADAVANNNDVDLFATEKQLDDDSWTTVTEEDILGKDNAKIGTLSTAQLSHHNYDWSQAAKEDIQATPDQYGARAYACTDVCSTYTDNTSSHPTSFDCTGTYVYAPLVGIEFVADLPEGVSASSLHGMPETNSTFSYGDTFAQPSDPTLDAGNDQFYYAFAGWYTDATYTTPFDFSTPLTSNWTTVYAKWEKTYVQNPSNESGTPASTPAPTATPAPAATPAPTAAPAVIPQTGDSLPLAPLMGVAALAVVAFVALLIGKKRRDR